MKPRNSEVRVIIIISSNIEWKAILHIFPHIKLNSSPFGQWFSIDIDAAQQKETVIFFHGGWGKFQIHRQIIYFSEKAHR
jgi:hypothetical protein